MTFPGVLIRVDYTWEFGRGKWWKRWSVKSQHLAVLCSTLIGPLCMFFDYNNKDNEYFSYRESVWDNIADSMTLSSKVFYYSFIYCLCSLSDTIQFGAEQNNSTNSVQDEFRWISVAIIQLLSSFLVRDHRNKKKQEREAHTKRLRWKSTQLEYPTQGRLMLKAQPNTSTPLMKPLRQRVTENNWTALAIDLSPLVGIFSAIFLYYILLPLLLLLFHTFPFRAQFPHSSFHLQNLRFPSK